MRTEKATYTSSRLVQTILGIALYCVVAVCETPHAQYRLDPDSPEVILLRSNDYLELLNEHWPRISLGDVDSMVIAYNALNNCWWFREKLRQSSDVDEFVDLMKDEHPDMQEFGRSIYFQCRNVVDKYDLYPGWKSLRLRAAIAGDRHSRLMLVQTYYRQRYEKNAPREKFGYSPAEYLIEAIEDLDPNAFVFIALGEAPYGMREDSSPVISAAWWLAACHYSKNCLEPGSMALFCNAMASDCLKYANGMERIRAKVGSPERFSQAQQKAKELVRLVEDRLYEDLGLDLVW